MFAVEIAQDNSTISYFLLLFNSQLSTPYLYIVSWYKLWGFIKYRYINFKSTETLNKNRKDAIRTYMNISRYLSILVDEVILRVSTSQKNILLVLTL
jgi:hypothetical protein